MLSVEPTLRYLTVQSGLPYSARSDSGSTVVPLTTCVPLGSLAAPIGAIGNPLEDS